MKELPVDYYSLTVAWQSGWHSAANGKTACQNPWHRENLRARWKEGWDTWHGTHSKDFNEPTGDECITDR